MTMKRSALCLQRATTIHRVHEMAGFRHCEERSDAAIQIKSTLGVEKPLDCFALLAMTNDGVPVNGYSGAEPCVYRRIALRYLGRLA